MLIKGCIAEDFTNYKKTSIFIIFPTCDFKCDKENGVQLCQNWTLSKQPAQEVSVESLVNLYINNSITHAVVCGGLEPFKSFGDLIELVKQLRNKTDDDIVIFTGYYEDEIAAQLEQLKLYKNIIVKFGRFIPNQESHFDEVLGVYLASDNQYAKKIS